jgi:hypothetical protein
MTKHEEKAHIESFLRRKNEKQDESGMGNRGYIHEEYL